MTKLAYVSVGSNLGNKLNNCYGGISNIGKTGNSTVLNCSDFYLTSPTDYEDQSWFVNAVVKIKTVLTPHALLNELIAIQRMFGRKIDAFRFGPRKLDLDIIFYGNQIISSPDLKIPHVRMQDRLFVLRPICDIDPDFIHPVFKVTMKSILENVLAGHQRVIPINTQKYWMRNYKYGLV